MRIDDCIFDLYGTLVDIRTDEEKQELWEKLCWKYHQMGLTSNPKQLKKEYEKQVKNEIRYLKQDAEYDPEIDLTRVFARLFHGARPSDPLIWEFGRYFRQLSIEKLQLYPGAREMLLDLHTAGKRVWLLSNAQRVFTEPELQKLGIEDCFDGIYISSDYGCRKPDPRFFTALLKEQKINPEHAIMIGNDGICDIEGARKAGLHTLYLHSETSPEGEDPAADYKLPAPDMKRVTRILLGK